MSYLVAERFKSVQGEGVWAGTPMAFIRFVGCSVGKKVCNACDTAFEQVLPWQGGGEFEGDELVGWTLPFEHVCFTGGEPLDQDLPYLIDYFAPGNNLFHIETSGTRPLHTLALGDYRQTLWVCVSPKPGFLEEVVKEADEVKVIVPGLGAGGGWPTLDDAMRWAGNGKTVFLQPKNLRHELDRENLALCQELVLQHPQLRLSVQLHKLLRVR